MNAMIRQLFDRFAALLFAHRRKSAVLFVVVSLAVAFGATRLEVDFSARGYFGGDEKKEAELQAFSERFSPDDNVVVAVVKIPSLTKDQKKDRERRALILDEAPLLELKELTQAFRSLAGVKEVHALSTLPFPQNVDGGLVFLPPTKLLQDKKGIDRQAQIAVFLNDDVLVPNFLSKDGRTTAIFILLDKDGDDIGRIRPVVKAIEEKAYAKKWSHFDVKIGGTPAIRASLLDLIMGDQTLFVPASFLLMALLLWLLFRRFHGVFLPLLNALLPSLLVMGVMGYLAEPIGLVNQVYFTLLPVIAVSGAIHLLSRFYEEAARTGTDKNTLLPVDRSQSLRSTLMAVGGACLFSAFTTVVGLSSLHLSNMHVLQRFGKYSAVGVGFAFLTLVVVNPLVLSVSRARALSPRQVRLEARVDELLGKCAELSLQRPKFFFSLGLFIFILCAFLARGVEVNNHISQMLSSEHPTSRAGKIVDEELGGLLTLDVELQGDASVLLEPHVLRALFELEKFSLKQKPVRSVQGPASLLMRMQKLLIDDDKLPENAAGAAQLLFLAEGTSFASAVISDDKRYARLSIHAADEGSESMVRLASQLEKFWDEAVQRDSRLALVQMRVTGTALNSYLGLDQLVGDLVKSVSIAFFIIIFILSMLFGSLRIGLLMILPNTLPLLLGAAFLAVLGWPLQPGTAVIFTVALGIAVDDTIHLLVRSAEEEDRGATQREAIKTAIIKSGRPVIITTIILCAGFGVNAFSSFPTNAMAGALGAFVIFNALIADLFVLPAVLVLFAKKRG
ncbi:MAG: MMPL family transporter [Deltaproteobacteria bacterium]|nr:MMPL family transporter [Deltaproteobacteria bacterium]